MSYAKFVSLTVAVLMLIAGVGCIVWRSWFLAVCCAVLSGYALSVFFEAYKAEIVAAISERRDRS